MIVILVAPANRFDSFLCPIFYKDHFVVKDPLIREFNQQIEFWRAKKSVSVFTDDVDAGKHSDCPGRGFSAVRDSDADTNCVFVNRRFPGGSRFGSPMSDNG